MSSKPERPVKPQPGKAVPVKDGLSAFSVDICRPYCYTLSP